MSSLKREKLENLFLLSSIERRNSFSSVGSQNIILSLHTYIVGVFELACFFVGSFMFSLHLDLFELFVCGGFSLLFEHDAIKKAYGRIQNANVFFDKCFVFGEQIQTYAFRPIRTKPFTIIAFQMAYGFHFLSFRNDFRRRFPFIFIHLHNSMHLETLMCVSFNEKEKKKKMKALYVSRWRILVTKN